MSIVQEVIRKLTNTIPNQLLYEAFTYDHQSGPAEIAGESYSRSYHP
jgi:hypothetical protein